MPYSYREKNGLPVNENCSSRKTVLKFCKSDMLNDDVAFE